MGGQVTTGPLPAHLPGLPAHAAALPSLLGRVTAMTKQ